MRLDKIEEENNVVLKNIIDIDFGRHVKIFTLGAMESLNFSINSDRRHLLFDYIFKKPLEDFEKLPKKVSFFRENLLFNKIGGKEQFLFDVCVVLLLASKRDTIFEKKSGSILSKGFIFEDAIFYLRLFLDLCSLPEAVICTKEEVDEFSHSEYYLFGSGE